MQITELNYEEILPAKSERVWKAIDRVNRLIDKYKKDLPEWEKLHSWDFNLLHDLEYRLVDRSRQIHSEYCSFNWDKYQFNAY